ncbi:MAG: hypothetical protein QXP88_00390 [Thermoproteota archaeon]
MRSPVKAPNDSATLSIMLLLINTPIKNPVNPPPINPPIVLFLPKIGSESINFFPRSIG